MFRFLGTTVLGRRGRITTAHGALETPFFFPVGTGGAMRGIGLHDLGTLGAQGLLCNTYHLHIQPGERPIERAHGLHRFIGWEKPIITDSGGFQVFSLKGLRKITAHGVHFRSYRNGAPLFLGPESAMRIQHALGADIIMCFDECPPSTAARRAQVEAVDRTLQWAEECKTAHEKLSRKKGRPPMLFGIVQGGLEPDLRQKCAEELVAIGFDGYAIGGLAVGETEKEMYHVLDLVCPLLPERAPRYLMGVGRIRQMKEAVRRGIDFFDCVLPMREGRHGTIHLTGGKSIRIRQAGWLTDNTPIDRRSPSPLSRTHSKAYLCHLIRSGERYGEQIACMQNLGLTLQSMDDLRARIDRALRRKR